MKKAVWFAIAITAIFGTVAATTSMGKANSPRHAEQMHFALYEPQKVVYHLQHGGGWFGREHRHVITVTTNHVNAVGEGYLDLRIILQGDGVDLLSAAKNDKALAKAITTLRKQGVRFQVCYNTLSMRGIDYKQDLLNVRREDIVSAGVAEVAKLEAEGFVYLKM